METRPATEIRAIIIFTLCDRWIRDQQHVVNAGEDVCFKSTSTPTVNDHSTLPPTILIRRHPPWPFIPPQPDSSPSPHRAAMSDTISAIIRFQFTHRTPSTTSSTDEAPLVIEYTHPVPTFLTQPALSQQSSQAFTQAFIDVISIITHQHHDECMTAITSPCPSCSSPATDLLKSPISLLHLSSPTVIIHLTPVCGNRSCEAKIRSGLLAQQKKEAEARKEEVWSGKNFGKMDCAVCGAEDAKRCAGCGTVAYCGKECQKSGWKKHRRYCQRKGLGQDLEGVNAPVAQIWWGGENGLGWSWAYIAWEQDDSWYMRNDYDEKAEKGGREAARCWAETQEIED